MKTTLLAALCSVSLVLSLNAQTSPENQRLAEELCDVMKVDGGFDAAMEQMKQMQTRMGLKLSAAQEEPLRNYMQAMQKKARPILAEIYAQNFTAEELSGMIAFFRSPVGQKWIEKQPAIQGQIMEKMQAVFMEMQPELMKMLMKDAAGAPKSE